MAENNIIKLISSRQRISSIYSRVSIGLTIMVYEPLYNNQINARALSGQSAVGYCAGKPTEKSRVF